MKSLVSWITNWMHSYISYPTVQSKTEIAQKCVTDLLGLHPGPQL